MSGMSSLARRWRSAAIAVVVATTSVCAFAPTEVATAAPNAGPIGAGEILQVKMDSPGTWPVVIAVVQPATNGYVTVWPCGAPVPATSNVNFTAGYSITNMVLAQTGVGDRVCIRPSVRVHLVADSIGGLSGFRPVSPTRLLDTRLRGSRPSARTVTRVKVAGIPGVPALAPVVAATFAAVSPANSGYTTVYPCGQPIPNASILNFAAGQTVANMAFVRPGTNGEICIVSSAKAHVLVDLAGYVPNQTVFAAPPAPRRVVDTRSGFGGTRLGRGETLVVPSNLESEWMFGLNIVATRSDGYGYLEVHKCDGNGNGGARVIFYRGRTVSNFVFAAKQWGDNAGVCVTTTGAVDVVIDVYGQSPPEASVAISHRILDTRTGKGVPSYDFLVQDRRGRWGRWSPCGRPITYVVADPGTIVGNDTLTYALNSLDVTGFNFERRGWYRGPADFDRYDLVIGYGTNPGELGLGTWQFEYDPVTLRIEKGYMLINAAYVNDERRSANAVYHLLTHVAGLAESSLVSWEEREAGLWMVGAQMPCIGRTAAASGDLSTSGAPEVPSRVSSGDQFDPDSVVVAGT